jgi:hypothetical protein
MDPHKKALLDLKKTARQMRYDSAGEESDDLNELTPSEPADMKNPPLPQHFLEELPLPKKEKKK